MRKTLFLSERTKSGSPEYKYQAEYIFSDRGKWRQDSWYFNDIDQVTIDAKAKRFLIQ